MSIDPPINKPTVPEIISQNTELGDALEVTPNQTVDKIHTNNNLKEVNMYKDSSHNDTVKDNKEPKAIDINKTLVIDIAKCLNESHERVDFESDEWKKLESTEESTLFRIVGLEGIRDEKLKKYIRDNLYTQIKKYTRHKVIIDEKSMLNIWPSGVILLERVKNLWIEVSIENDDQIQSFSNEHLYTEDMKIVLLKLPLQNLAPHFVDRLNWVVLELPESPTNEDKSQARSIVQRCNDKNTPVWIYDEKVRTNLLRSDKTTLDATGAICKPVYLDLPTGTTPRLVNKSEDIGTKAKQISEKITSNLGRVNKSEMEMGYRLSWLDFMARQEGKSQFWKQHFDMNNRSEYCSEVLNIKPDLASQYLTAIRNINILSPEMLANAFRTGNDQKDDTNIPHGYTRYRDLKKYMPVIVSLQEHEEYSQIIEKIFSYELSNRKLMNELPKMIEKMTGEPLPTASPQAISPIEYVRQFSKRVDKSIPDDKKARFNELIAELKSILQSHDGTTVTVESEVVTPEKEAVEITTVNDTTPDVEKEAA